MRSIICHASNEIVRSVMEMHNAKEIQMVPKICSSLNDKKISWAVITAYRPCQHKCDQDTQSLRNQAGNIALWSRLRDALGRGSQTISRFVGKWPPSQDTASTPEMEESFLVCKPKHMSQEEFESLVVSLGARYNQDYVVVSSNGQSRYLSCKQNFHGDES